MAVLTIGAVASTAHACFVCVVPYQSILDKAETSNEAVIARAVDKQPAIPAGGMPCPELLKTCKRAVNPRKMRQKQFTRTCEHGSEQAAHVYEAKNHKPLVF
jgi:hypothetical protein